MIFRVLLRNRFFVGISVGIGCFLILESCYKSVLNGGFSRVSLANA